MSADRLRALHRVGDPLVLPNAWDADTARLVVEAGFPVVATSSKAVAAALGYDDGTAPAGEMLAAAARIAAAVDVPVTVDAEAGYGLPPAELAGRLLDLGAHGANLEDSVAGVLTDPAAQADRIAAVRAAAGADLVVNARVDTWVHGDGDLADGLDRARRYLAAGADCVYPIFLPAADAAAFTAALAPAAVNLTPGRERTPVADLAAAGAARVSLGAGLWLRQRQWLADWLTDTLAHTLAGLVRHPST